MDREDSQTIVWSTLNKDNFLFLNKTLIFSLGSIEAAAYLSHLIFRNRLWRNANKLTEDGFFYCTEKEIEEELLLSPKKQRKIMKILTTIDADGSSVLQISRRDMPRKNYFKLNYDRIIDMLNSYEVLNKHLDKQKQSQPRCAQTSHLMCPNVTSYVPKRHIISNKENLIKRTKDVFKKNSCSQSEPCSQPLFLQTKTLNPSGP